MNRDSWRKLPSDFLTDEEMCYMKNQLPPEYAFAPYMFYLAALRKADEDGIFDLEDGVIFAQLMCVSDIRIVFKVAALMVKRHIIVQAQPKCNKCLIVDWDCGKTTKPMEQRRQIVALQIQEAEKRRTSTEFCYEAPEDSFNSFEMDDKNTKNVVQTENSEKNGMDDKNTKNVVQNEISDSLERKKERKKEIKEQKERNTHTNKERKKEAEASAGLEENPATASAERKAFAQKNEIEPGKEKKIVADEVPESYSEDLAVEALQNSKGNETMTDEVADVLTKFFCDQNIGFDVAKGKRLISEISANIRSLETKELKAELIVQTICSEFIKMHEEPGVWHDIPLFPAYMQKESVWAYLLTQANKRLKCGKKSKFIEQAMAYEEKADELQKQALNEFNKAYEKYGINPNDPQAPMKLIRAKAQEQKPQEVDDAYGGDIF